MGSPLPKRPRKSGGGKHRARPDPAAARVGERVRRLRAEGGFTFDAFVEETGLGRGYISELERGLVVPSLRALRAVARALEVTVADLVVDDSPRERLFEATRRLRAGEVNELLGRAEDYQRRASAPILRASERIAPPRAPRRKPGSRKE